MAELVVDTEQGKLRGKVCKDFLGGKFYSFEGIPYAKPPVGELRFKAPQPPVPWQGVRDATKQGQPCYSLDMIHLTTIGSEDCLFLNVHTPKLPQMDKSHDLKPVMVWIHGGGFLSGSGNRDLYGPEFLITEDVVVVTINYRLGALGFLYLKDPKLGVPGNAGLKDQVMALKWVKSNIRNFGGDPDNVTIFGESAGGASVHYLMLSPMAKGLFHKAIAQSGCALNPWAWGRYVADDLCKILKSEVKTETDILKALQETPIEKLFKAQLKLGDHMRADKIRPLGPVIEKITPYEEAFLSEPPLDIMLQGRFNQVPLMLGYTSREGMLIDLILFDDKKLIKDFEETVPFWLDLKKKSPLSIATANKIKKFYFGDKEQSLDDKDELYLLHTDNLFLRGIYSTTKLHATKSKHPVFLYRFSLDGPMNVFKLIGGITNKGAAHGDELGYLFKNFAHHEIDPLSIDCECITKMVRLWANFAKYGDPNLPGLDETVNVQWKPVTGECVHFMDIDFQLKASENPEQERMEFWDDVYKIKPTCANFEGIPSAKPPVGELRFKAPQSPVPWQGIRDATKQGQTCYSLDMIHLTTTGSEDCLFLNVHTPKLPQMDKSHDLKPVMVWIHEGGFLSGSGNRDLYGTEFLITEYVVVVTINYRLGVLGFLYLKDPKLGAPGNAGLKDQVMALKWIKSNIKNFGGDPDNVTIFGESAGGASVHYFMLSPMAKGLFHKVIAQSGCALNPWAWGRYVADDLCKILKSEVKTETDILKALQETPIEKLFKAQLKLGDHMRADKIRPLGPVIEKITPYEEAFLSEPPLDIMLQGRFNQVPLMLGYTSREGMLIDLILFDDKKLIKDFEETVPFWLDLKKKSPLSIATANKIKKFYFCDKEQSLDDKDELYLLHTDNLFLRGIHSTTKLHATKSKHPVVLYRFSLDGPMNVFKLIGGITNKGAAHGDELGYLFKNFAHHEIDPLSIDCECITKMVRLWANFAKYGDPNLPGLDETVNVQWKPVTGECVHFMDIDFQLKAGENPEQERMEFWDDVYKIKPTCAKL